MMSRATADRLVPSTVEALALSALEFLPNASAMVFDSELRYVIVRGRALGRHGFDAARLEGRPAAGALGRKRWAFYGPLYHAALAGETCSAEVSSPDGERWYQVDVGPLRDGEGEIVGGVSLAADITERKQAQEVAAQLAAIIESSDDAVVGKTLDGKIVSWNRGAERMYGYAAEVAIGRQISFLCPPDREDEIPGILARLGRGDRVEHFETVREREDGSRVDVSLTVSPVLDAAGKVVGASTIARDVSDRKRTDEKLRLLSAELERRVEELQAANGELEAFAYSISHDLRAPLRAIDGFSQRLLSRYAERLDPDGRHALERVRAASQRMALLIDEMLGLSRLNRRPMRRESIDLSGLAGEIVDELRDAEPERRVDTAIQPGLTASGDRELLRAALSNLLGNAFKFTGEVPRARVEFAAHRRDGETVFSVRDNGAGFDMAYADKLFRPFERLHSERRFSGDRGRSGSRPARRAPPRWPDLG